MYDNSTKNKYYEKKTLVTINSKDRIKRHKLITDKIPNKVKNNGLKLIDSETILVDHPNHNLEIINSNEIIFKNIIGVFDNNLNKYTIAGIPVDFLNYNSYLGKPIFNIEMVYTYENNKKISNSYKIKIPVNIDRKLLKINSSGGGDNIIVELIKNHINGYEDASFYKIALPRRFKNIKNVRMVNLEMSNAQYAIRDKVSKIYNNNDDYIDNNNFLYWINEDDVTQIKDKFLINNEKLLNIVDNNLNNIPADWIQNISKEKTLYEYLSSMYLKKIETNLTILKDNFINLLYFIKNQIINNTNLTESYKSVINNEDSYLLKFNINNKIHKLFLYNRINSIDIDVSNMSTFNKAKNIDKEIIYIFNIINKTSADLLKVKKNDIIYDLQNFSDTILITDEQITIKVLLSEVITDNKIEIILNKNTYDYVLYTLNINTIQIVRYYIDDFYTDSIFKDFIYKFTNYDFTLNTYNTNLNDNFIENVLTSEDTEVPVTSGSVNIFNYLRNITEYYKETSEITRLYFNLTNNSQIKVEYNYIQYLFNNNVNIITNELKEYSYNNININNYLKNEQNNFISYLVNLYNNILDSIENETHRNILKNGYLFTFYNNSKIYNLYFYNKPENESNVINYNISDLENDFYLFIDFIKNFSIKNPNNSLNYSNYYFQYTFNDSIDSLGNTTKIPQYTAVETSITELFTVENEYILPKTTYSIDINTIVNLKINIYRNISYTLNFTNTDINNKLIVSTSDTIGIDYNYNNSIVNNNNSIVINISNYENINNLYILKKNVDNSYDVIVHLSINYINEFKYDFSIYGYLHNISLNTDIQFIYNNNLFKYVYINNLFNNHIENINKELNKNISESFNLLTNRPNLSAQFYWTLQNKINTNIYIKNIERNTKMDTMIENKYNYNDLLNIKYLYNNIDLYNIYPIYSIQIKKGNYMVDDFTNELEDKLNSISKKIYNFKKKIFENDTVFKTKSSLKIFKNKSIFKVDLNENNNLVKILQYKNIYEFSISDIKSSDDSGPFIVNEGYPYIYIKLKNSVLKTGDLINITGASSFFNFKAAEINKTHIVYNHTIYRGYIRFILPLDDIEQSVVNNSDYFYDGNTFVEYSNYKYGLNKINNNNSNFKNIIGNNSKQIILDNDISIYELFTNINNLTIENKNKTKLGRVLNIVKDGSQYIFDYHLLSEYNFEVGDIIKTNNTNTYIMFVPENWNNNYLPKKHQIINNNIEIIENINEGFSIKVDKIPNQSNLKGIGGVNISLLEANRFSLLFDKDNTLSDSIGFEKKMTDFDLIQSNTYKSDENIIDYSFIEPSYFDEGSENSNYIMIKTLVDHNYDIGSYIYLNNHLINYNLISDFNNIILNIKEYVPFIVWFNDLPIIEQSNLQNSLNTEVFTNYCEKGVIIYYLYPYTKKQKQHLGNLGMSVMSYEDIDYFNFKEAPYPNICNLKPDSYIYIKDNQQVINKNVNGINVEYKIGFRDGYYKVLNNIPTYKNSYYKNYFNNTNCALIECNYIRITEEYSLNTINYNESINSIVSTNESILEGYLNNGIINNPKIDTNIIGNIEQNTNKYDNYKTYLLNKIDSKNINIYYPVNSTNNLYLNNLNNIYYLNNCIVNKLDIYENINYIIDISNTNLLNKNIIISDNNLNITPYLSDNDNIVLINGLPGQNESYINIKIYNNLINKFYIYIDYVLILELNIKKSDTIVYNVNILDNNNIEFINSINNNVLINPILNIEFGVRYIFQFSNLNIYNNFILINEYFYNVRINTNYITYNINELNIEKFLNNNNYNNEIFYQLNNTEITIGKFVLGIHNYYNNNRMLLINSNYIDNIDNKYLNNNSINTNNDTNIINYVITNNTYYFKINLKMDLNILDENTLIIPYVNIFYLEENCKQDTNIIKIKNSYDILYVSEIKSNVIILKDPNYNLYINKLIILQTNIPNSLLKIGTYVYIISIDDTYSKIQIGNINDKALVEINDLVDNSYSISFINYTLYNYKHKNELINKSIKINYLESYNNLVNTSYNNEISRINEKKIEINISNKCYYNFISTNIKIIENNNLQNLNWTTPHGAIYIDLLENNIINYIKFNNINSSNNNHPYKAHLYYIESNVINYIGTLIDVISNNIINNNIYNKKNYIIYIETYGLYNNTYSSLSIPEIELGYINPIMNDIAFINKSISRIAINNIINKYKISDNILNNNSEVNTNTLLLNNNKSSVIEINFETQISLKYYSIIQNSIDNTIIIGSNKYITNFNGTITSIQLFGSNYLDYSDEEEIIDAKYINSNIFQSSINNQILDSSLINNTTNLINHTKTFINEKVYKYYRFKILSNVDYYPYLKPINNVINTNNINEYSIEIPSIPNNYLFNYNNNSYNIEQNKYNLDISGIIVGNYEIVDYSKLYIEDINYITDVNITKNNIELTLKYNLLNSHLKGENVIISNSKTNENLFSTQNLIIYNKWYTRIFYQGYNSIYNSNHISKTDGEYICNFKSLTNNNDTYNIYSNSKYTFINDSKLNLYKIQINNDVILSINEIVYNTFNIDNLINNEYENSVYTILKTNNINNKYIDLNVLNINKIDYKIIILSRNDYDILYNNLSNYKINIENKIITKDNEDLTIKYLNINFKKNNNKEGLPIIQDYLTNNIHIENMNGFYISEDSYKLSNNQIVKVKNNNTITPLKTMNYDTFTYTYLDLVYKSDNESLNISDSNLYNNGIPIFGYFNNNSYIDDYSNNNFYINYYSITVEGKYQGYGGMINNKKENKNNLFNDNLEGFRILDIGYDNNNNKNLIKLDLKISELGIKKPKIYVGDINSIDNINEKNKYVIGYGGNVYQKKIFKNIDALSGPKYLYLSIKHLDYILTTNKTSYFTKVLLKSSPGNHLYESTFIDNTTLFERTPLDELSELEIRFINDEGKLFDLENTEHTMVLEITEYVRNYDNSSYLE